MTTTTTVPLGTTTYPFGPSPANRRSIATFNANYNAVELSTSVTLDTVFNNYITNFAGAASPAVNDVAFVEVPPSDVPVDGLNDVIQFRLAGWKAFAQPPFRVLTTRFDAANHTIAVFTLPGHPLYGSRYFRTFQLSPGHVVVETGAVDLPSWDLRSQAGFYWAPGVQGDQVRMWKNYLTFIANNLQVAPVTDPPEYTTETLQGRWYWYWNDSTPAKKTYIMTQICGHAPAQSGFCQ